MKRKLACLLLVLTLFLVLLPAAAFADEEGESASLAYVTDAALLLQDEEREQLEQTAAQIAERYQCGVYIIIVDDYSIFTSGSIATCAEEMYDYYHLGYAQGKDGLLLLMSMEGRDYDLDAYGDFGNYAFTDYGKQVLADSFMSSFSRNDWYNGFLVYLHTVSNLLNNARSGHPVDVPNYETQSRGMGLGAKLAMILLIPGGTAGAVCGGFKRQMKTVRPKTTAEGYVVPGGVDLAIRQDLFVNRTQTVQIIQESQPHRSGGGGTSVGASGHSHHSGKF